MKWTEVGVTETEWVLIQNKFLYCPNSQGFDIDILEDFFLCMCLWKCTCKLPKGRQISWKWSYRQLWTNGTGAGSKLRTCGRVDHTPATEALLQALVSISTSGVETGEGATCLYLYTTMRKLNVTCISLLNLHVKVWAAPLGLCAFNTVRLFTHSEKRLFALRIVFLCSWEKSTSLLPPSTHPNPPPHGFSHLHAFLVLLLLFLLVLIAY